MKFEDVRWYEDASGNPLAWCASVSHDGGEHRVLLRVYPSATGRSWVASAELGADALLRVVEHEKDVKRVAFDLSKRLR